MSAQTHSLRIGDIELTVFNDGRLALPAAFFGEVPDDALTGEVVEAGANLWTVRTEDRLILVDTGSADALKARFPETGQAWESVSGLDPTDVVLTHMHADHIGGFASGSVFSSAVIHVARAEWEFWTDPGLVDATPEDRRPMVQAIQAVAAGIAEQVVLHEGVTNLAPGVDLMPLPGHTPGHTGVRLSSGDEALAIVGDAIISAELQIANPTVTYALDGDAGLAVETRSRLLSESAASGTPIAVTHFAFPGIGTVALEGDRFRFRPLSE